MIVAAPVIAELNMPRFMASGDTSRLTLDITNLTDKPQKLNVALTASGLLELVSDSPAAVELAPKYYAVYPGASIAVMAMEKFRPPLAG